jgi:two-component system, OmpR family, KDP operon response regulator KdpE
MEPLFLIVEDDSKIRNFIKFSLKSQEYKCLEASTGKEAFDIISTEPVTTIIIDLGLPDIDGLEIIKQVRTFSDVPIIVVSARDQDIEKVEALDAGADDYLSKPFSINELLARIRVIFRHTSAWENDGQSVYKLADLEIDLPRHKVTLRGEEIHFTPMEFKVITLLLRNYGKVLTHNFILKEVWGSSMGNDVQSLRVFMANIRRKIEDNPAEPRYIITEVGVGYLFADE